MAPAATPAVVRMTSRLVNFMSISSCWFLLRTVELRISSAFAGLDPPAGLAVKEMDEARIG
jgi:hypothetical protein